MHIQAMPEHFSEWNEEMVARHDPELFHRHPRAVVRWIERVRVRTVRRLLRAEGAQRILEVGCGAGNILARIPARPRHGLDLSRRMTARALQREPSASGAAIVRGDAELLPYRDAVFERVLCSSVLSHVFRPERVLHEAFRVLQPGGRLVVSVSYEAGIERGIRWARALGLSRLLFGRGAPPSENVYSSEYHLHQFDMKLLRECAEGLPPPRLLGKIPWLWPAHLVAVWEKEGRDG